MEVLEPRYHQLYRYLQHEMVNGALASGPGDTFARYHNSDGSWQQHRGRLHQQILEEFQQRCQGLPRGGNAVLLTSGPPGAGKSTAQQMLAQRQGQDDELGRQLNQVHGVELGDYVRLDPDEFKAALLRHGGFPPDAPRQAEIPGQPRLAPAEMAALVHRESSTLNSAFERWARSQGYNLLYDGTMRDLGHAQRLLGNLRREGYGQRLVVSVEVDRQTAVNQNALRWQYGRKAFDEGRDAYGGRMAPEPLIHTLYPAQPELGGHSVGRLNAEIMVRDELATALIAIDRTNAGTQAARPYAQLSDAQLRHQWAATVRGGNAQGTLTALAMEMAAREQNRFASDGMTIRITQPGTLSALPPTIGRAAAALARSSRGAAPSPRPGPQRPSTPPAPGSQPDHRHDHRRTR
ncbi:zeta toxin family protein [Actinomadura kijaniata]|uniref:zeta toxin family protein n=1 Tax=Actinomadura kijaniata TaxID=46161 RepID=UPI000829CF9C|nr:zeta toxin family protein [Actinomadura kijaniata]